MVLLLDSLGPEHLRLSLLSKLLEQFIVELLLPCSVAWERENRTRQTPAVSLCPPENLLLDHLEQSLSVHRPNVDLGLEPPDLV